MDEWTNRLRDRIDEEYGTEQIQWDELWITITQLAAKRSRCSRDRVGAVLVSRDNVQLSLGYNGAPASYVADSGRWCNTWCQRAMTNRCGTAGSASYDDCPANHAEVNTLLRAPKHSGPSTMYVSTFPCTGCAKFIGACATTHGITEVVAAVGGTGDSYRNVSGAIAIMRGSGISVRSWPDGHPMVG